MLKVSIFLQNIYLGKSQKLNANNTNTNNGTNNVINTALNSSLIGNNSQSICYVNNSLAFNSQSLESSLNNKTNILNSNNLNNVQNN